MYFAELTELTVFSPPSVAGPIAALALPVGQNEITVAHASENTVRRWSLETNLLVAEVPVGVVADNQTSFSADATRLASFSGVWDARSGAEIWCYTKCDHAKSQTLFYPLDSWVIGYTYGSSGLAIWCIDPACNVTFIEKLDSPDEMPGLLGIDRVALEESGKQLAVAFQEGLLRVYAIHGPANLDLWYRHELGTRILGVLEKVDALTFDPTGTWLAMLRAEQLHLWDLKSGKREPSLLVEIEAAKKLAFDRGSQVLVVGTDRSLLFFELSSGSLLASYPTPTVTAIALSPDGRLVLWGDAEGTTHIWGYQE
ncbi:MAG: WD40 repeat domain-containing protein [Anaerolineales bacterium]